MKQHFSDIGQQAALAGYPWDERSKQDEFYDFLGFPLGGSF